MLLNSNQRLKLDNSDDTLFYAFPRFVTHVDDAFITQLTQLYREKLQPNTKILDLMSSWVSHLPPEMDFAHVEGHGLNAEELSKNQRFNHYFVQDLNKDLQLPFPDKEFDAVLNCVSVQYLQYPDAIFYEIYRVLKPGGVAIFSFSNRMFYQKAIFAWREASESQRVALVEKYFNAVRNQNDIPAFSQPEVISKVNNLNSILQMFGLGTGDPFYAVIAYRQS
jgi:SAM-dependent methyltransferase